MNVESGFQLSDIGGILRRRARAMMWTALAVSLSAYWIAMALPNEFESYSTILVEPQAVSRDIVAAGVGDTDLTERLGLMAAQILARSRLSKVIDDLALYPAQSETMERQMVINLMRDAVRVEPVVPELERRQGGRRRDAQINTFRIFFRYENAATAALVAQTLANDFIEQHIKARVRQSEKSLDFIDTELGRLAQQIRAIESKISEVKSANPGRLPEDLPANRHRLDRLSTELSLTQRALADASSDEAFYRMQSTAAVATPSAGEPVSPARRAKALELLLAEYHARGFTSKHPDLVKAELELRTVRSQIVAERDREIAEPEEDIRTLVQQTANAEARRAEQRRGAAAAEIQRLHEEASRVQALLGQTPAVAEQLDGLDREYRHLFGSYQDFSKRKLEATVQAQLERRQLGEQFRVLEQAFRASEPISPNRPLIVILGVFFSLALAGATGILLEASDPAIHTPRQLQAALGMPVLGAIPEIWLEYDRGVQRRARIRTALATLTVVVFAVAGGALNYMWVNGQAGSEAAVPDASKSESPTPQTSRTEAESDRPGPPDVLDTGLE